MARAMVSPASRDSEIQTVMRYPDADEDLSYFIYIDKPTEDWLGALIHTWELWKKCDPLRESLTNYISVAPNPYLSTLRIIANILKNKKTNNDKGPHLADTVIEEFSKWIEPRKDTYKDCLTINMKVAAFKLLSTCKNKQLISSVAVAYNFQEHKEKFLRLIENMIIEKKYKDAAMCIAMLQLQEHFPNPETVLLPLILQSKLSVVETVLEACPEMLKSLIMYLDYLVLSETTLQNTLAQLIKENDIPLEKKWTLKVRSMSKFIARLVKLFNIPQEYCPNLNNRQRNGALRFLVHKRYVDGSLGIDSWRELLLDTVKDNTKLQSDVITMLVRENDSKEGLYWARKFNIPEEQWPWALVYTAEQEAVGKVSEPSTSKEISSDEENAENFHKLRLPKESIIVIDNAQSFQDFLQYSLKDVAIVGLDCEWKPTFGSTHSTQIALIQIATASNVYILDVTTIGNVMEDLWYKLGLQFFDNNKILKVAYGISSDMAVIRESLPPLSRIQTHGEGYLDIEQVWKKLIQDDKFLFPYECDDSRNKGLSKLVELCVGHGLNKSDQCSNWVQRPLRKSQLMYAALDAYCLLEIYDALERQCEFLDIPFHDICAEIRQIPQKAAKKTKTPNRSKILKTNGPQEEKQLGNENAVYGPDSSTQPTVDDRNSKSNHRKNRSSNRVHDNWDFHRDEYPISREIPTGRQHLGFQMQSCPIPVHKWRVVCDSMLGGLTSKLRLCGCDCVYVMYDEGGDQSARLAMDENRVLLTRNKQYLRFMQYLQPDKCYRVISNTPDDQLREVLKHFGVVVTQRDILSRCRRCNYDEFVQVPNNLMNEVVKRITHRPAHNQFERDTDNCTYQSNSSVGSSRSDIRFNDCANGRTWRLSSNSINFATCTTKYQVRIQIDKVPSNILKTVRLFYICENCGKVYWDGSHLKHTLNGIIRDLIVPA